MKIQFNKTDSAKELFEKIANSINELYDTLENIGEIQNIDANTIVTTTDLDPIKNDISSLNSSLSDITNRVNNCIEIINTTNYKTDDLSSNITLIYGQLLSINSSIVILNKKINS